MSKPYDILERFKDIPLDPHTESMRDTIMGTVKHLATETCTIIPDCRERSIALTKLEEYASWMDKALARNQ